MSKRNQTSRLKEVSFSSYNLRDAYISSNVSYLADLRDEALFSNYGIKVLVRIPANDDFEFDENNVDEYSNFVTTNWIDTVESVVPRFTEYRQNVSENGMSADGTDGIYPLEVMIPTKLHLPRDSRLIFSEYDSRENEIVREWTVLGTQMKQLSGSKTYTRVANCVPSRKDTFISANTCLATIWFDHEQFYLEKSRDIRAQGNIWFVNMLPEKSLVKRSIVSDIYEDVDDDYTFVESVSNLLFYDYRPQTIVFGGYGFKTGDEIDLKDNFGNSILISETEDGSKKTQLRLIVNKVNEYGSIIDYKLNVEKGFTSFGKDGELVINIGDSSTKASIKLTSVGFNDNEIFEKPGSDEISKPKYISVYRADAYFAGKKIAISVLS